MLHKLSRPVAEARPDENKGPSWIDPRWAHVQRVLAVRLDNIGDVIMVGPALRAIKAALPASHVTLMATPAGSQAAAMLPWVDDVIIRRVLWQDISGAWAGDAALELDLVAELRSRNFDAAVIFTSFTQSPYPPAYVAFLAGIPIRVAQSREFGGGVLSQWVRPLPDDTHQVDRNLHLLQSAGFPLAVAAEAADSQWRGVASAGRDVELVIPPEAQHAADHLLDLAGMLPGEPFVAIAPGASAQARRYDVNRYAEVARRLVEEVHPLTGQPLRVFLLGSSREAGWIDPAIPAAEPGVDSGRGTAPGLVSLIGRTSVPEMAGIINRASLLIANNSGPLHMADALRRPMVILYSGSEYESQWRPRSAPARLLRKSTFCTPCFAFHCRYRMECLDIAPETVVAEALAMLAAGAQDATPFGSESRQQSSQRSYDANLNVARAR